MRRWKSYNKYGIICDIFFIINVYLISFKIEKKISLELFSSWAVDWWYRIILLFFLNNEKYQRLFSHQFELSAGFASICFKNYNSRKEILVLKSSNRKFHLSTLRLSFKGCVGKGHSGLKKSNPRTTLSQQML